MSLYQVLNPATDVVEEEFETATDAEVDNAIARADAAYDSWRTTSYDQRAQVLGKVADAFSERADELGDGVASAGFGICALFLLLGLGRLYFGLQRSGVAEAPAPSPKAPAPVPPRTRRSPPRRRRRRGR